MTNGTMAEVIASRRKELELTKLEVESAKLENEYLASEEYQELSARAKQNKSLEGETLVYLPKNTERAKTKHKDNIVAVETEEDTRTNFEKWMSFLFGV